jgi:hypothetical protein
MKTSGYFLQVMVLLTLWLAGNIEAGLLLEARGEIRLQRRHWRELYSVQEGVQLYRGDLLRLATDARAVILCADFATIWSPISGELSGATQGCPPPPDTPLFRDGQRVSWSRSETDLHLPSIIVPRKTVISDPHPMLRWNAVPGAQQYTVQVVDIRRPGRPVWGPITVRVPSTRYPTNAPALQPEMTYIVQVTTDSGAHSPTEEVGFRLASAEKQQEIARRRDELRRKIPQDTAQRLALAVYFWHQYLCSEAPGLLDTLVQQSTSAPVHLLRAHVLLETGVIQAASQEYTQARDLAVQHHDRESQADALVGLARTAKDHASMRQYYQEAMTLYHVLGERERAGKLAKEMGSMP